MSFTLARQFVGFAAISAHKNENEFYDAFNRVISLRVIRNYAF